MSELKGEPPTGERTDNETRIIAEPLLRMDRFSREPEYVQEQIKLVNSLYNLEWQNIEASLADEKNWPIRPAVQEYVAYRIKERAESNRLNEEDLGRALIFLEAIITEEKDNDNIGGYQETEFSLPRTVGAIEALCAIGGTNAAKLLSEIPTKKFFDWDFWNHSFGVKALTNSIIRALKEGRFDQAHISSIEENIRQNATARDARAGEFFNAIETQTPIPEKTAQHDISWTEEERRTFAREVISHRHPITSPTVRKFVYKEAEGKENPVVSLRKITEDFRKAHPSVLGLCVLGSLVKGYYGGRWRSDIDWGLIFYEEATIPFKEQQTTIDEFAAELRRKFTVGHVLFFEEHQVEHHSFTIKPSEQDKLDPHTISELSSGIILGNVSQLKEMLRTTIRNYNDQDWDVVRGLTAREIEYSKLSAMGFTNQEIGKIESLRKILWVPPDLEVMKQTPIRP